MKKVNYLLGLLAMFAALSFSSCSDDDNSGSGGSALVDDGTFTTSKLTGVVRDVNGKAINGATVENGTQVVTTDANGVFTFDKLTETKGRVVLKISKSGYNEIIRAMEVTDGARWDIVMLEEYSATTTSANFTAGTTATLKVNDEENSSIEAMKVELPDAYKNASTGATYTGYVTAKMTYLDPDAETFAEAMPGGDLAAVREDGSDAQLVSYGMVKVDLTGSNGEKLQLADGEEATVTFAIPTSLADKTPESIPLWSFNEKTGLWEEEGKATLQGDVYVGKVKHFSWWNLDWPESRAEINVTVKDTKGEVVPYTCVDVDGQRQIYTNKNGKATCFVPANTSFYVTIHSKDYANYTPEVKKEIAGLTAGTTKDIDIVLPAIPTISGKVTNKGTGSKIVTIYLKYDGKETAHILSDIFGKFTFKAPMNYTGTATIYAITSDGNRQSKQIEISDKDINVNFEFNTDSGAVGGGVITITSDEGDKATFAIPEIKATLSSGVTILDSLLTLTYVDFINEADNFKREMVQITISNYEKSKNTFSNARVMYRSEGGSFVEIWTEQATVTLKESKGLFTFTIKNADASFYSSEMNSEQQMYKMDAEIKAPLNFRGHSVIGATKSSNLLPSFAPYINNLKFDALVVDECNYLGKGGCAYYKDSTLTRSDYDALVTAATKSLGKPVYDSEVDDEDAYKDGSVETIFLKDKKFIFLQFDPDYRPSQRWHGDTYTVFDDDGKISVSAFENVTLELSDIINDDDYYWAKKRMMKSFANRRK